MRINNIIYYYMKKSKYLYIYIYIGLLKNAFFIIVCLKHVLNGFFRF